MTTLPMAITSTDDDAVPADRAVRLEVSARITAAARAELCQRPDDLSLRAVARRAGVDPRQVHALVESREQLIANVMFEIAFDAHAAVRPVLDAADGTGCRVRLLLLARAFRAWAQANPAEFWILLGPRRRGVVDHAGAVRAMRWFYGPAIEIFATGLDSGEIEIASGHGSDRASQLVHPVFTEVASDLDPRVVGMFLGLVTALHGYLVLEACGQLAVVFGDLDRAFDVHMRSLIDAAGIR